MQPWIKELKQRFPDLFRNEDMYYSCCEGWKDLIIPICEDLQKRFPEVWVFQFKEKFGRLRFYVTGDVDLALDSLISDMELKSATTCEYCGKPGKIQHGGWMRTLCDECNKK